MKKKIYLITLLSIVLFSSTMIQGNAQDSIEDLQKFLEETENKIDNINNEINKAEQNKDTVENEINKLDFEMEKYELEIDSMNYQIKKINSTIDEKQIKVEELNENINDRNELLEKRLRVMYKKGFVGYVEVLLDSEDIRDFLTRLDMVQRITDSDVELLKSINNQMEEIKMIQMQLQNQKNEIVSILDNIKGKKNELDIVFRAKSSYMSSLEDDINELKKQEDRFLNDSEKLEEKIQKAQLEMKYAGGDLAWPSPGVYRITSPYGMRLHPVYNYWKMHSGIDIGVPYGTKLVAANDGVIQFAGYYGAYGNLVIIDHGGGISTVYGHNSKIFVTEGQKVTKGEVISRSGDSGLATGPHLHFEVRENGVRVDPMSYYNKN